MTTQVGPPFTDAAVAHMNHLATMVREHHETFGTPEGPGDFTVCWESAGWWVSIVCPGHYAFEREGQPDLAALLAAAVTYYGEGPTVWNHNSPHGCQEHHPMPEQAAS